jgi:serine/threonine protein kinase
VSYCLNPNCPNPQNLDDDNFCQRCGWGLLLQQRYRPIQLIAQGRFGRTFLAVDQRQLPAQSCLLKQFCNQSQTVEIQEAKALFQQEICLLEALGQHPQIPTLLANFEVKQCLYSVQEFIEGNNLVKVVEQEGTFTEAGIWQFLANILPVIKFIHDHQVIHRDIKPKNIIDYSFFSYKSRLGGYREGVIKEEPIKEERRGKFVLVDLGTAKIVTAREALQPETLIGSPEYAAPLQFRSDLHLLINRNCSF